MTTDPRRPIYPTPAHERAAEAVVALFRPLGAAAAVVLAGSCARGKATRDSCVDVVVLVSDAANADDRGALEHAWARAYQTETVYATLRSVGRFSHVDLLVTDGRFTERPRGWTTGPDSFELEIGNTLVYAVPIWERDDTFGSSGKIGKAVQVCTPTTESLVRGLLQRFDPEEARHPCKG